jgi:hypothetical protein
MPGISVRGVVALGIGVIEGCCVLAVISVPFHAVFSCRGEIRVGRFCRVVE